MYLARGKQPLGMPFNAEVSLMEGVEGRYQTPERRRRAAMYVPPAATWVLLAGERIYELCKSDHDRKDGAGGSTSDCGEWLWKKGRGYSLERWAFWKQQFSEIATTQGLKDDVKDIAARAAAAMEKTEG